tara:strand:+ start:641 stop:1072 length:432 start_codon:yes stop_codon:yes gene_type:complete
MAVSVKDVHRSIAARIDALTGYREVRMLPQYFGRSQNTLAHLGFAVDISNSNASDDRQRRVIGALIESNVRVKIAYRIRPHDIVVDYGNALDKEQDVIATIMNPNYGKGIELRLVSISRNSPDSQEYLISEILFSCMHTIQIT